MPRCNRASRWSWHSWPTYTPASRTSLPLAALLARLAPQTGPLQVLAGGVRDQLVRQQTLHNAIAWSYALLDSAEQRLFCQLRVLPHAIVDNSAPGQSG